MGADDDGWAKVTGYGHGNGKEHDLALLRSSQVVGFDNRF
jgi:hypothetical protein